MRAKPSQLALATFPIQGIAWEAPLVLEAIAQLLAAIAALMDSKTKVQAAPPAITTVLAVKGSAEISTCVGVVADTATTGAQPMQVAAVVDQRQLRAV